MSEGRSANDDAIIMQVARGAEALTLLEMLSNAVAEYSAAKDAAGIRYQREMERANGSLAGRVSSLVLTAERRIELLQAPDDDDDDDDDD